ncbi:MAG: hypothetical protein WCI11_06270 [Candidatus Methylumidiphilus sp.]
MSVNEKKDIGIWKLIGAILLTSGLLVGGTYAFSVFGLISPLKDNA